MTAPGGSRTSLRQRVLRARLRLSIVHRMQLGYGSLMLVAAAGALLLTTAAVRSDHAPGWQTAAATLFGVAALVGGGFLVDSLARDLARPFARIAEAAQAIAAGQFDARVPPLKLPEAQALGERFNEMAAALEGYNSMSIDRLLAEQRRNEAVLTSIDDGLIILDGRGRIERVNPVAARQLGVTAEAAVGRTPDEVLGRALLDAQIAERIVRQYRPLDGDVELEIGQPPFRRTLSCALLPFHDLTRPGLVMLLRDVTAERELERLRTEFVLRASHELRTPVTGMGMALELLGERCRFVAGSREADLLDTVCSETRRLSALVNDLLDLSRLDGAQTPLKYAPCVLAELIDDARARFGPLAEEAGVLLQTALSPQLAPLQLDAAQFSRVLDNLVGNAIRHTPRGGRVLLRAQPLDAGVAVEVVDSGEGIPTRQLRRIFDPFVQVGANTGGAGLGLTLCREIVEQHGGRIEVRSQPGEGATFRVHLPWAPGGVLHAGAGGAA